VIIASYTAGDFGSRWISVPEEKHAQYVLDAMVEIHGQVARKQYTGRSIRRCWLSEEYQSGGWAIPSIGQHKLYIPSYFNTENNVNCPLCNVAAIFCAPIERPTGLMEYVFYLGYFRGRAYFLHPRMA
jgi:hypothetical protein